MHIVMFSINPLFPDIVMGGAPKHLQNIAIHMGNIGHYVTVLATQTDPSPQSFQWGERVTVKPVLPFKQPFPQPYAVPTYDTASVLQIVGDHLQNADRFYMHDGEFLFPYAYQHVPTVVSLRDNVYPETLLGSYLFQGHRLILISDYSRQYFTHTTGRFFPDFAERITVIHNGLDWDKFKPTPPQRILDYVDVQPENQTIVLHPHRPEESKGIMQTIEVINLLVNHHGLANVIALAPRWHDVQASGELREFYDQIEAKIVAYGLTDNFVFHGWIPQELMPEYYSLGSVTLSPGYFQESFGNAVYESLGCGTPSIAARITTHRELLPDALLDKVDYGDVAEMAKIAAQIIREGRRTSPETMAYLHTHYGIQRQLAHYAEIIEAAEVAPPLVYQHPHLTDRTRYRLAPWCYLSQTRGIYHDFEANYTEHPQLIDLIQKHPGGFTPQVARQAGISEAEFQRLFRSGIITPLP